MRKYAMRAVTCLLFATLFLESLNSTAQDKTPDLKSNPKIQVALLLDVSGSMQGLLEQAKEQLWNMAVLLSRVTCAETTPSIEIALYEYGRKENIASGFIKQHTPFTSNLDTVFSLLASLKITGWEEHCGQVMFNAITELSWDSSAASYKSIFIAGNESFLQGNLPYVKACGEAKQRNIFVNTIYCGDKTKGIAENWDLGTECGNGSFSNIDHNARPVIIRTPYEDSIMKLKDSLMQTFIVYGKDGKQRYQNLMRFDTVAMADLNDPTLVSNYVVTRASDNLYDHIGWDLVDAAKKDPGILDKVDMTTLEDSLMHKTREELKKVVGNSLVTRNAIEARIKELAAKQKEFIKAEKERRSIADPVTLETEMERIIRTQVRQVYMKID